MSEDVTIIRPPRPWVGLGIRELWNYRELLYFLIWRDFQGRHRQMALGRFWLLVKPLVTMVVFTLVFGRLAGIPSEGIPYPLFALAALVPWQFFSSAASGSASSLVSYMRVISKIYFPRLVIPTALVAAGLLEMAVSFLTLMGMMLWYGVSIKPNIFLLPFYVFLAAVTALSVGLWLACLSVRFRDVTFALNYLMQVWLFMSPVAYPSSLVPDNWRWIYVLNPMVTVIEGFRWCLLDSGTGPTVGHLIAGFCGLVALAAGVVVFRRTEQTVVDLL